MEKRGYIHKDWTKPEDETKGQVKSAKALESHTTCRLSDTVTTKLKAKPKK